MEQKSPILCIGGLHFDCLAHSLVPYREKASNPVRYTRAAGGVAHNIACNMVRLGTPAAMVSLVGGDSDGAEILADAAQQGVNVDLVTRDLSVSTASYLAVLDETGELATGLSDTETYEQMTPDFLAEKLGRMQKYARWVVDANLSKESLNWLGQNKGSSEIFAAPVSPSKALRWKNAIGDADIFIGNEREADILSGLAVDDVEGALKAGHAIRAQGPRLAIVTLGPQGAVVSSAELAAHFPIPDTKVVDVNGAGDAFFAGFCQAYNAGLAIDKAVGQGVATASLIAETIGPIRDDLSLEMVAQRVDELPTYIKL